MDLLYSFDCCQKEDDARLDVASRVDPCGDEGSMNFRYVDDDAGD
jgi:hypothetical protein